MRSATLREIWKLAMSVFTAKLSQKDGGMFEEVHLRKVKGLIMLE